MMEQIIRTYCQNCLQVTPFRLAGSYNDGSLRLLCICCHANGVVLHYCPCARPVTSPKWLPLLLSGIKIVCPECKAAYDLGVKIEPVYLEAGRGLQVAGLLVGGYILINVIADILRKVKRSRR